MKYRLLLSTDNKNKIKELDEILKDVPVNTLSKSDLGLENIRIEEDGKSLEENALKKAKALYKQIKDKEGLMVLADDTGLFVKALNGEPGIYSARYSEEGTAEANNKKLLSKLGTNKNREAYFETVIALILDDGEEIVFNGICKGKIGEKELGENGFGYDPIFIVDDYGKTFAELSDREKNQISHRGKALENLKTYLESRLKE